MQDVRSSFDRAKALGFAERFYDVLLASDPKIRAKFAQTNFAQQRDLLVHGVYAMLDYAEGSALGRMAIERLAIKHGSGNLDVTPRMYERWLVCFIDVIAETDPAFTAELGDRWKQALKPALEHLIRGKAAPK